ncbi:MAG: hypothetical protein HRU15_18055, partial [Planctomycetes bacterium]|nr:hypothetical protein [Planctomycetota bacterium]
SVLYTATWVAGSGGGTPTSYSWVITGDASSVGSTTGSSVIIAVKAGTGSKSFAAKCTTEWDAPDEHTPKIANGNQSCKIIKLIQFSPKSGVFPKCVNSSIGRDDFVMLTQPAGYEGKYDFNHSGTATPGVKTATLEFRSDSKTTNYEIVGSNTWVKIAGFPKPGLSDFKSTHTEMGSIPPGWFSYGREARLRIKHYGSYKYDQIGSNTYGHNDSFVTTVSTAWNAGGSIAGKVTVGLPFGLPKADVTITASFGWETSTTHTLTSNGGEAPYEFRAFHYQVITDNIKEDLSAETRIKSTTIEFPWEKDAGESYIGKDIGNAGANKYHQTKERKCPPNS